MSTKRTAPISAKNALVVLIDCDSFQVNTNGRCYPCEVGVPLYTPPELQKKSFRELIRTRNHDRFGLAILIFQLLFVGRHPYAGRYLGARMSRTMNSSSRTTASHLRIRKGPQNGTPAACA